MCVGAMPDAMTDFVRQDVSARHRETVDELNKPLGCVEQIKRLSLRVPTSGLAIFFLHPSTIHHKLFLFLHCNSEVVLFVTHHVPNIIKES